MLFPKGTETAKLSNYDSRSSQLSEVLNNGNYHPYSSGALTQSLYNITQREEKGAPPSRDYVQSEEWANAHGYFPDARGHRDDRVKKPLHPTHPSRGSWSGNYFQLTDKGLDESNHTLFGMSDGGLDPQAIMTYGNSIVLPEITVTPNGNYVHNTYDNIKYFLYKSGGTVNKLNKNSQRLNQKSYGRTSPAFLTKKYAEGGPTEDTQTTTLWVASLMPNVQNKRYIDLSITPEERRRKLREDLAKLAEALAFVGDLEAKRLEAIKALEALNPYYRDQGVITNLSSTERAQRDRKVADSKRAKALNEARSNTIFRDVMPNLGSEFAALHPETEELAFKATAAYLPKAAVAGLGAATAHQTLPFIAKHIAAPMAAGMAWDEASKALTGTTSTEVISNFLLDKYNWNPFVADMIGGLSNPGYWINFGGVGKYTAPYFNKIGLGLDLLGLTSAFNPVVALSHRLLSLPWYKKLEGTALEKAIMKIAGYDKLYHGVHGSVNFNLKNFKSSDSNFGIHMTKNPEVAHRFHRSTNPFPVKSTWVKTRKAPVVIDMMDNNYNMFNPKYALMDFSDAGYLVRPEKNSAGELFLLHAYPEYKKLRSPELRGYGDYEFNIPAGMSRTMDFLKVNWPNMPKQAKAEYDNILNSVKNKVLSDAEANDAVSALLKKYKRPVLTYRNMGGERLSADQFDYIITDPNAMVDNLGELLNKQIKLLSNPFKPFNIGYNLIHSIGKHPLYRYIAYDEMKNLLDNNMLTLKDAKKLNDVKIKIDNNNPWRFDGSTLYMPSKYRRLDKGFSIRHELGHVTYTNGDDFIKSKYYNPNYKYENVTDPDRLIEELRADYFGGLNRNISLKEALGIETKWGDAANRIINNSLFFKPSYIHVDYGDSKKGFHDNGSYIKNGFLYPGENKSPSYIWWNHGEPFAPGINGKPFSRLIVADELPNVIRVRDSKTPIGLWNGKTGFVRNTEYVTSDPINISTLKILNR